MKYIQDYIKEVQRTAVLPTLTENELIKNFALCIFEKCGEVSGVIKKYLFHGHELDREKLIKELGDLLWYFTAICNIKENNLLALYNETNNSHFIDYPDFESEIYLMKILQDKSYEISTLFFNNSNNQYYLYSFLNSYLEFINVYDITLAEIMQANTDKLRARYKDKFTFEESKNR